MCPSCRNGNDDARPARRELATHAGTSAGPSYPGHGPITSIMGGWDLAGWFSNSCMEKVFMSRLSMRDR